MKLVQQSQEDDLPFMLLHDYQNIPVELPRFDDCCETLLLEMTTRRRGKNQERAVDEQSCGKPEGTAPEAELLP